MTSILFPFVSTVVAATAAVVFCPSLLCCRVTMIFVALFALLLVARRPRSIMSSFVSFRRSLLPLPLLMFHPDSYTIYSIDSFQILEGKERKK
jgi:hypothetical protein